MVLGSAFTQFLNRSSLASVDNKHQPMQNTSITTIGGSTIIGNVNTFRKKTAMRWYRQRAGILTGIVNMVARDTNEEVYFEPVKGIGRNRVLAAKKFFFENCMQNMFFSELVDCLVTGEGYAFVQGMDKAKVMKEVDKALESKGMPVNDFTRKLFIKANIDEDAITARAIRYVASSTMENVYDQYEIKKFVQRVAMNEKIFGPEEIIHLKLLDVDGMVEGFTPVTTINTQLELDEFMWENMKSVARNGGQPDKIFSAEDIDISSPAFKRVEKELQKYHAMQNRHGSLLLNGKITVQELQQLDSMQFKELGLFIVGLVALQWSVPRSRIPHIVGGANTKDDTGGNSEKAYYNNIRTMQNTFDSYFNRQLWMPKFGVVMKRKQSYKQDDLVETQTKQTRLGNLSAINNELAKSKKTLSQDYVMRYFNGINEEIGEEDVVDLPEPVAIDPNPGSKRIVSDSDMASDDSKAVSATKKQNQDAVVEQRGKPTGYGKKELDTQSFFIESKGEDVYYFSGEGITKLFFCKGDQGFVTELPTYELSTKKVLGFNSLNKAPLETFK